MTSSEIKTIRDTITKMEAMIDLNRGTIARGIKLSRDILKVEQEKNIKRANRMATIRAKAKNK